MSTSRDQILARIRAANRPANGAANRAANGATGAGDDADAAYAALPREYLRAHHDPASGGIADLFAERTADYRAVVERVPEGRTSRRPSPGS